MDDESSEDKYIFVRSILRENILVRPQYIGSNYKDVLRTLLSRKVEGVCTPHGYILPGSVSLLRILSGRLEAISLNGDTVFNVQFSASVCNPPVGMFLRARVVDSNMFAIFTQAGVSSSTGEFLPVIYAIIVKAQHPPELADVLGGLQIGSYVYVEITGKRFEIGDKRISVIGMYHVDGKDRYERMFKNGDHPHQHPVVELPKFVVQHDVDDVDGEGDDADQTNSAREEEEEEDVLVVDDEDEDDEEDPDEEEEMVMMQSGTDDEQEDDVASIVEGDDGDDDVNEDIVSDDIYSD